MVDDDVTIVAIDYFGLFLVSVEIDFPVQSHENVDRGQQKELKSITTADHSQNVAHNK